MTTTALERRAETDVSLFAGATAADIIGVAAETAQQFSDVVKKQRMFKRIGDNDHIQIEAWQTIGALTGVLADDGEVTQLPWPDIEALGDEPPRPEGREPRKDSPKYAEWHDVDQTRRAWEVHRDMLRARALGRAFGFKAAFHATKNGMPVGWGEGRCTRGEAAKVNQDDYALSSMAQTRGQSRALGAPLKFVVKLAGYETTPAEELDGADPGSSAAPAAGDGAPAPPWGPVASDGQEQQAANLVRAIAKTASVDVEAEKFVLAMGQRFDGVPEACVMMLKGLARFIGAAVPEPPPENAPPATEASAYHNGPEAKS